jgi:hypothetical protein
LQKQSKEKTQLPVEPTRLPKNSPNRKAKPNQWKGKGEKRRRRRRRVQERDAENDEKKRKKVKESERKNNKIMIDV